MGKRTSIYLSDGQAARIQASGMRLGELVNRGLERTTVLEDTLRSVLADVLSSDIEARVRTAVREELAGMATPVAACSPQLEHSSTLAPLPEPGTEPEQDSTRAACRHPASQVHEGLCIDCGTWLG